MARKPEVLIASVALVLALAALVGVVGAIYARPAAAQAQVGVQGMRQITVIGNGEAKGTPDTAQVQIGVETRAPEAAAAVSENNQRMAELIAKLKEQGVADADIQTAGFNVSPDYDYEARQVRGYVVSNSVSVTIRDLENTGGLLDAVVQAGANNIYGVSFSVADPKAVLADARQAALDDARAKALQMAQASGATLGDVLVITENIGSVPPPMPMAADMAQAESRSVPVQPGSQSFNAQVQVTFALR
jgi:uncharacterized protein